MAMEGFWGDDDFAMRSLHYAIRSEERAPTALLPEARDAVWSVNANLPLANPRTLDELLDRSLARTSFTLVMLGIAAVVALLMGTVGIYGVLSYLISQRTQEIGVRMALGAERRDVRRMMLRQGMLLAVVGIGVGAVVAALSGRLMQALLFGVEAIDPLTYVAVALFLAAITLGASWMAAQRATRVDPLVALRAD
jgi:ABC-type antimicrobial peptide transport system permease subunit